VTRGRCILARKLHWHYEVGREVRGMASLELSVVKMMTKHTTALLEGLVGVIRGPANPKSGGGEAEGTLTTPTLSKVR
jgi:hypothetical protein